MRYFVIFVVVVLAGRNSAQNVPFVGQNSVTLGSDYKLDWTIADSMITIQIGAPAKGWVGFGLSPTGGMQYADILMAGVDATDTGYILDTIGLTNGAPYVDPEQNWKGMKFMQVDGYTTVVASRALSTGDPFDREVTEGKLKVIWAYNREKDVMNRTPMNRHAFDTRGMQEIDLMAGSGGDSGMKVMKPDATPMPTMATLGQTRYNTSFASGMTLEWYFNAQDITFEVSAPTVGWVGIGFAPGTNMVNADLIVVGKAGDGSSYVYDAYSLTNGPPREAERQDVTLISVMEENGNTKATFRRKLDTGDAKDRKIEAGPLNVLWAYGSMDMMSSNTYLVTYHQQRGHKSLNLLSM